MNSKTIIWKSEGVPGEERLVLNESTQTNTAISHAIGGDADLRTRWDVNYTIIADKNWHVREVSIKENISGRHLAIQSDGLGHWRGEDNKKLESIDGCIDIDFRATPFSNTFPIRRLQLAVGQTAEVDIVYINAPDLQITKERQVYTRLAPHTWKFEQPSANFEAVITVDDEGLVTNYPGLFNR